MHDHWYSLTRLLLGAVLVLTVIFYVAQYGRSVDQTYPAKTFSVDGTADLDTAPDIATFTVSVVSEGGQDVAALQATNTAKMNQVTQFMKGEGIDPKDLKTVDYSLNPRYSNPICSGGICPQATIVRYALSQSLQVKVRDTGKLSDLLAGAVKNGGNTVSQVQFTLDDDTDMKAQAREQAIEKARTKALDIARASGFRLGKLVNFSEDSGTPQPTDATGMGGLGGGPVLKAAPDVQPGTQNTSVTVTLTYEILN